MSLMEPVMTISPDELRQTFKEVFSQLASGVCVVTFWRGGRLHGFTATSVTSVSLAESIARAPSCPSDTSALTD